jgi:hypothetical protein
MVMKRLGTLFCLLLGAATAVESCLLVRVDLCSDRDILTLTAAGADVLARFEGWCIARTDRAGLARLEDGFACTVLDEDPAEKRYVFVFTPRGFDRARLTEFGTELTRDNDGVLLRTDAAGGFGLNRLPVDLYAVSMRPMFRPAPEAATRRIPAAAPVPDSLVWTLVNRVSQDSLAATLRRLIAFRTRYATTESCYHAVRWMCDELAARGCDSTYQDGFLSGYAPNAVGIRFGKIYPQRIFAVTAHIDNTSEDPPNYAPGSDDNASGCGLVLELARVCADVDFASTVWFVGFSAEEQGLFGSDSFLYAAHERGDSILAAFHSDMISYGRDDSLTVVHTTMLPETESLAQSFLAQADTFTGLQVKDTVIDGARSDHYSFWKYGYPAIRGRYHDETPRYHTTGDTIGPFHYADCGTNNLPMYSEMVKAVVATIARWAGAFPRSGTEEPRSNNAAAILRLAPTVGRAPVRVYLSAAVSAVSVYTAAGRVVKRLGRGAAPTWDGRDCRGNAAGPGVYYFRAGGPPSRFVLVE